MIKKIAAEMGFLSAADFLATYSPFFPPFTSRFSGTLLGTIIRFRTKSCIHFSFTLVRRYVSRIMIFVRRFREIRIKLDDMKQKIGEIFIDASWNMWHVDRIILEYISIDRKSIIRYRFDANRCSFLERLEIRFFFVLSHEIEWYGFSRFYQSRGMIGLTVITIEKPANVLTISENKSFMWDSIFQSLWWKSLIFFASI